MIRVLFCVGGQRFNSFILKQFYLNIVL